MNESNNITNGVTRIRIDALPMDKKVKYLEGAINEFLDAFFGILKNEKKGEAAFIYTDESGQVHNHSVGSFYGVVALLGSSLETQILGGNIPNEEKARVLRNSAAILLQSHNRIMSENTEH